MPGRGRQTRPLLVLLFAAAVLVGLLSASAGAAKHKRAVLTVGVIQNIDSLNPLVGVVVPDFDVWNLQYETLTEKAANDFHNTPGLAKSWSSSPDKKTWTYKLRDGLKWSDGKPLTAADVVFTINRGKKEHWLQYTSIVKNLTASAPDPKTVVIRSSVPDPKLPTMDVYVLPEHIWGKYDKNAITKYAGLDGVGSGPFTLTKLEKGQFWRMKANSSFWKGRPALDEVVFRFFNNADAMVAALKRGELDAAHGVPNTAFRSLKGDKRFTLIAGQQGGFDELAINGGAGLKKPHPALLDPRVREAIALAIDKNTIVKRVYFGLATPADTISPSANPEWNAKIPDSERLAFDLKKANAILDKAGYKDTNGDGIREMPGGGKPLNFRYAVRSESSVSAPIAEFITGWLRKIGIGTTQKVFSDSQLNEEIGKGNYDLMVWGWTPFADPDPQLFDFTCSQVSHDPKNPTNYANDASWCSKAYDKLYGQQKVELDHSKRVALVHKMLKLFYKSGVYDVLYHNPDLQAYRNNRFTGWTKQPANIGPVLFSNTSPTYFNLKPIASSSSGGGLGMGGVVGIAAAAAILLAAAAFWLVRRRSVEERE